MTEVTIYTTPTCTYCRATKAFFTQHHIAYREVDAAADRSAARLIVEKTGQLGVPVTIITKDGTESIVLGFDQKKFRAVLGIAG